MSPRANKKLAKSHKINFVVLNVCFIPYLTISALVWLVNGFSIKDYLHKMKSSKWLAEYHERAYYQRG